MSSRIKTDATPFVAPRPNERHESAPELGHLSNNLHAIPSGHMVRLPDFMVRQDERQLSLMELTHTQADMESRVAREPKPTIVRQESIVDVKRDQIVYPMNSRPKGLFLCINNVKFDDDHTTRDGAEKDEENIMVLFRKLGYRTQCFRDLDYENFMENIKDFAQRPELSTLSSVVISVMSHGQGTQVHETNVITTNGIPISCEWIVQQFDVKHCPAMHGKPKIFLFQFCRGEGIGSVLAPPKSPLKVQADGPTYSKVGESVRVGDDVLIAFASIRGNVAHRDVTQGSWFIQAICRVYTRYACDTEITRMLAKVDEELKHCCSDNVYQSRQTCETVARGFKDFYFAPGVF